MKIALLAVLLALTSCGGMVGSTRPEVPFSEVVRAKKAIAILPQPGPPEWAPLAKSMTTKLIPKLEALGFFATVVDEAGAKQTQVDIELQIVVQDIALVSAADRQAKGGGAGPARLAVTARLRDRASGTELGRARVSAEGRDGPRGGTTEDAEEEVVRRIVAVLSGKPLE